MRKINTSARTGEVANVALRMVTIYRQREIDDSTLRGFIDEMEALADKLVAASTPDLTKSDLADLDIIRDNYWLDLVYALQGYSHLPKPEFSDAADRLLAVVDKYGAGIIRLAYGEESTKLESALLDLKAEELRHSIESLPCIAELIELLQVSQSKFHAAQAHFDSVQGAVADRTTASDLRKMLLSFINDKFIIYLQTMEMLQPDRYKQYCNSVAETIEATNSNIYQRRKSKNTDK